MFLSVEFGDGKIVFLAAVSNSGVVRIHGIHLDTNSEAFMFNYVWLGDIARAASQMQQNSKTLSDWLFWNISRFFKNFREMAEYAVMRWTNDYNRVSVGVSPQVVVCGGANTFTVKLPPNFGCFPYQKIPISVHLFPNSQKIPPSKDVYLVVYCFVYLITYWMFSVRNNQTMST